MTSELRQSTQQHLLMILLLVLLSPFLLISQEKKENPKIGLSAAFQNSQLDILLPIWLNETTIIAPAIRYISVSETSSDLGIGIVPRFYLKRSKVSPFFNFRAALLMYYPKDAETITDYLIGLGSGGEYFFDSHFSIGIEAQLNVTISSESSNRFNNPGGTNLNTATVIYGSIYF